MNVLIWKGILSNNMKSQEILLTDQKIIVYISIMFFPDLNSISRLLQVFQTLKNPDA